MESLLENYISSTVSHFLHRQNLTKNLEIQKLIYYSVPQEQRKISHNRIHRTEGVVNSRVSTNQEI